MSEEKGTLEGFEGLSSEDFVNNLSIETKEGAEVTSKVEGAVSGEEGKPAGEEDAAADAEGAEKKSDGEGAEGEKKADAEGVGEEGGDGNGDGSENLSDKLKAEEEKLTKALAEAKNDDEKAAAQKAFDEAKAKIEEETPFDPESLQFSVPGEEGEEVGTEGNGWSQLSKEIGFEVENDDFDTFKAGLDEHYKNKYEVDLGKYEPEAQRLIQFLNAGGKTDAFVEPLKPIKDLQALSDIDLIEKDLELRNMSPELIEKEINKLTEDDQVGTTAFKLREKLNTLESQIRDQIVSESLNATERSEDYKKQSAAEQLSSFKKELNKVSDFLEIPIADKHKQYIIKNLESGKYADLLESPKMKVLAILQTEFGKDGISLLKKKVSEETRREYKKDRHAIPPVPASGGAQSRSASRTEVTPEGNWQALEGFNDVVYPNEK